MCACFLVAQVVDELVAPAVETMWLRPLNLAVDPVLAFRALIKEQSKLSSVIAEMGEPITNLWSGNVFHR
jgi:hypothetical protein